MDDSMQRGCSRFLYSCGALLGVLALAGSRPAAAQWGGIAVGITGKIGIAGGTTTARFQQPPDSDPSIVRLMKAGKFAEAIADLSASILRRPTDATAYAMRAQAYLGLNPPKVAEASADVDKALSLDPGNPAFANLRLQLAGAKYKVKDYRGAIDESTRLLAQEGQSRNKIALIIRASAYSDTAAANRSDTDSLKNAIHDYDVLLQLDPTDATSVRNRGVAYYRLNQFDKAIADFDGYIAAKPNEPDGYNFKGLSYLKMNPPNFAKAIEAYNSFLERKPDDTIALYNRGLAYYQTKAYDKALPDFQAASKNGKHPNAKDIPGYIADCLIKLGKAAEAEKVFTAIICKNDGEAYLSRGSLRLGFAMELKDDDPNRKAKLEAALADFNQAVKWMPNQVDPLLFRALVYFRLGQWDGAIADSTAVLKIQPNYPDSLITRADAYYNLGKARNDKDAYAAAIADYKAYLALPGLNLWQIKSARDGLALATAGLGE